MEIHVSSQLFSTFHAPSSVELLFVFGKMSRGNGSKVQSRTIAQRVSHAPTRARSYINREVGADLTGSV